MSHKDTIDPGNNSQVELNVMPFIDVFSLLCTFLLFSAVWVAIGILEVQVPFFTNAPAPDKSKPERELEVSVVLSLEKIVLQTSFSLPPVDKNSSEFQNTDAGREGLHEALVKLKKDNAKADKLKLFVDDDVVFQIVVNVLDAVKIARPSDMIPLTPDSPKPSDGGNMGVDLFPKVIMASVIL